MDTETKLNITAYIFLIIGAVILLLADPKNFWYLFAMFLLGISLIFMLIAYHINNQKLKMLNQLLNLTKETQTFLKIAKLKVKSSMFYPH